MKFKNLEEELESLLPVLVSPKDLVELGAFSDLADYSQAVKQGSFDIHPINLGHGIRYDRVDVIEWILDGFKEDEEEKNFEEFLKAPLNELEVIFKKYIREYYENL